jgi:hypothetical protein
MMLSPGATYHAELREELSSVGRALSVRRALLWATRALAAGTIVILGIVIWAWTRDGVSKLPITALVAVPFALAALGAIGSLFLREKTTDLARRVDRAAGLEERSITALELGARGDEYPLAVAQMRDAVEHLKRVDLLEAFPLPLPRNELMTTFFVVLVAILIGVSPNPWLLRARASNPAVTIAREQAQRVQRLADTIQPDSAELEALRQMVSKGARTVEARSSEPDAALNALQDLEDQVRQMSQGDDQLAAALAAVASALASDPATQPLANAVNTGDMREIARAARDLAQSTPNLGTQERERVAKVLRDASGRAGRVSQTVSSQLSDAADALQGGAGENAAGQLSDQAANGQGQAGGASPQTGGRTGNQSASDALNQLSNAAAAAAERQRASSQLESSRNALERALGRTQSRSGSTGRSPAGSQRNQASSSQAGADQSPGAGQGQGGDQGDGGDPNGGGTPGSNQGEAGDAGQGGGYSSGGQNPNKTGGTGSQLNPITTPHQVPNYGGVSPDESSVNPYLGEAGSGDVRSTNEDVQPSFSRKPTQGNNSGSIPLGLRDLVKDYFSSLDQK